MGELEMGKRPMRAHLEYLRPIGAMRAHQPLKTGSLRPGTPTDEEIISV